MSAGRPRSLAERNRRVALVSASVAAVMVGLAFASAPLYEMFCRVTGFGGTPLRATEAPRQSADANLPLITIRFNADTSGGIPWDFQPEKREVKVRPGEEMLAFYRAANRSDRPVTGVASFNVTPDKAGQYFSKIACFCFEEQRLEPGQAVDMPVSFFVDPEMLKDPKTREIRTITLSYTFFRKPDEGRLSQRDQGSRGVN